MGPQRVLSLIIADDHAIVREGIAAFLSPRLPARVAAHCSDGEEALREILEQRPDVAIVDFHLPRLPVIDLVRKVQAEAAHVRVVVLFTLRDAVAAKALLQCGVSACLLKDGPASELADAIQGAMVGQRYVSPGLEAPALESPSALPDPSVVLSRREYEVFVRLADGARPRDIAKALEISPKTVDTYRSNIFKKLQVTGVAGLIRFAIETHRYPCG